MLRSPMCTGLISPCCAVSVMTLERRASHTDSLGVTSDLATSTATPPDQAVKQPAASATTASAVPAARASTAVRSVSRARRLARRAWAA
eukprot:scaffold80231_cov75-Phaeocystis_antarctica.AAC.2